MLGQMKLKILTVKMYILVITLVLLQAVQTIYGEHGRVVGGRYAKPNEFPHQVSFQESWGRHLCGGSIISPYHVVTAAHCVVDKYSNRSADSIRLVAGTIRLNETDNAYIASVERIIYHPDFVLTTFENDVAVLQVSKPFPLSESINIIPLRNSLIEPTTMCTTTGFGYTEYNGNANVSLLAVDVPIVENRKCKIQLKLRRYQTFFPEMLCAGYTEGKKDACQGDSGGPLVCEKQLTGIVSFGYKCASVLAPGVYTNVSNFIPWISDQMYVDLENGTRLHIPPVIINNDGRNSNTTPSPIITTPSLANTFKNNYFLLLIVLFVILKCK